jgi:ribonuclease HII
MRLSRARLPRHSKVRFGKVAEILAGVDEAGRGPLAGPVVAAAVILDPARPIAGLADSKRLGAGRRRVLEVEIRARALAWCIARAQVGEIDRINILQASLLAMRRAVEGLQPKPERVLVDGSHYPAIDIAGEAIVKGDSLVPAISAASILAKQARDAEMLALHALYPGYGFDHHKGYPTRQHVRALEELGPSPVHRRSFAPVRRVVEARRTA